MIGLSSQIGGMVSNLSEGQCNKLKTFGESLGMAYQVQDDILELGTNLIKYMHLLH